MKRVLYILVVMLVLAGAGTAYATPDGGASQRIENAASPTVKGGTGHIFFTAGSTEVTFTVYAITGQQLRSIKVAAGGHASIEMPKGFYIVRCNGSSSKVVVK